MPVVIALARHGALAPDVQGGEGVHLARVRDSDDHAVLLLDLGVGRGGLHAAELERRACVFFQIGPVVGGLHRPGGKLDRRAAAHRAPGFRNGRAVFGDAREVSLDHLDARRAAGANRRVQILDARFFEAERPAPVLHDESFRVVSCRFSLPAERAVIGFRRCGNTMGGARFSQRLFGKKEGELRGNKPDPRRFARPHLPAIAARKGRGVLLSSPGGFRREPVSPGSALPTGSGKSMERYGQRIRRLRTCARSLVFTERVSARTRLPPVPNFRKIR